MDPIETVTGLAAIAHRTPGSDAERRAARWLANRLRAGGRDAALETHWVRPQWPLVHGLHALLAAAIALLTIVVAARTTGATGDALNAIQFAVTLPSLIAVALLLDIALSETVPGANDPASAAAVVLAVAAALDRAPPRAVAVEV